jgi:hypothetical protein
MSDYLNNIVMRSLNLATVVQPRVPQLFEEAPAPAPLPDASQQSHIVINAPEELPKVSSAPTVQQTPSRSRVEETAEIEPGTQPSRSLPEPGPGPKASDVTPVGLITSARPVAQSPETPGPASNMIQTDTDRAAASTIGPLWQNATFTAPDQNPLMTPHPPIQPQLFPAMPASSPRNVSATPQALPIRISIGRVDVRAIMPASPAKAAVSTRSKPALSLESYLKQREEGKR